MSNAEQIAQILKEHSPRTGIRDGRPHCICGWTGKLFSPGSDQHRDHQAQELATALAGTGDARGVILDKIDAERTRQNTKWGEQNHPDGTGPTSIPLQSIEGGHLARYANEMARLATEATDEHAAKGRVTWADILLEEVFEALAESDVPALRTELIQIAAVATQWVEAIERREAKQ